MDYSVSLYLIDRAYGGPEEGGWWYTYGEPQDSEHNRRGFATVNEAIAYAATLESVVMELNDGRPDINSVISTGRYEFIVDESAPKSFPATRPIYS